jgi:hypothetical protein
LTVFRKCFTENLFGKDDWDARTGSRCGSPGTSEARVPREGLLRDGLDLNIQGGWLMAHDLASVAAYELEINSERQRAGIEAARTENGGKRP